MNSSLLTVEKADGFEVGQIIKLVAHPHGAYIGEFFKIIGEPENAESVSASGDGESHPDMEGFFGQPVEPIGDPSLVAFFALSWMRPATQIELDELIAQGLL